MSALALRFSGAVHISGEDWRAGLRSASVLAVSKTAAMQRAYDGKQPGDPARAAQAIIAVSLQDPAPLRLVLGRDAYARAERTDEARLAELRAWRETSVSTDFPATDA